MKFKKSLIIFLLFITLISIPISFASDIQDANNVQSISDIQIANDVQSDMELSQCYESNDLIVKDNLEENLDDGILKGNIASDESIDDEILDLDEHILSTDDESSQYEVSDSYDLSSSSLDYSSSTYSSSLDGYSSFYSSSQDNSNYTNDLPNLDTSFSEIEIICNDENTVFVNASYEGEMQNGNQSSPFKNLSAAYDYYKGQYSKTNIYLAAGTYNISSYLSFSKSVNLIGENTLNTIISGLNKNRLFEFKNNSTHVNIINLTLSNGLYHKGGAIYCLKSSLNIINSIFKDNHAKELDSASSGEGGAIYNDAGFIKIYNCSFIKNSGYGNYSKYGGAIYNDLGELSIFNSKFINNSLQGAWGSGGAIYSYNGFLTLVNSSIINTTINPTYHSLGGAICIWNGRNTYIINSTLSGNTIKGDYAFGSAIANKGVLLEIIDSNITNNFANGTSVANSTVYNINGIYRYENSIFSNNQIKTVKSNLLLCLEDQLIISDAFDVDTFGDLPSSYDLRDENLLTSVKNQRGGRYSDNCWAFAIYSALESYLLKYENIAYDFSENNMKNAMYLEGDYGTDWDKGGNHIMAFAYLLRGEGPVNESQDKYDPSSIIPKEGLSISKYITGFKYIPLRLNYLDNDQIKYAILQYGALYTSVDSNHFSIGTGTSYSNISSINAHAVAIVGWDDNYSASNFANNPPGDGAWIIKNSWGENDGKFNGYYYVSYYDSTFPGVTDQFAAIAISSVDNLSEYGSIYQYDMLGNTYESIGYNTNTAWFANEFTASSNSFLKAFGLYTFGTSSYLVNITVNGISKLVQQGNLVGAGYHTVKLNNWLSLAKGDKFKITVRLTTPDSLFPIAIESYRDDFSTKVTASLGQSFISPNGVTWYDIAKDTTVAKFYQDLNKMVLTKTNVCLKAYTEYADDLSLVIKTNSSYYNKGDLIKFNVIISNNGSPSGQVNVSSILDSSVSVVSYSASKGSFNNLTKVWTINNLNNGESQSLNLVLRFTKLKLYVNNSFSANSLSLSPKKVSNYSIVKTYSQFIASNLITKTVVKSVDGKSGKYLKVTLKDRLGNLLKGKKVVFTINKKSYYRTTNKKGVASLQINFAKAGTYTCKISFSGAKTLGKASKSLKVYVKKQSLKLTVAKKKYKLKNKKKYLTAILKNAKGKRIKNKKLIFTVNGKKYKGKTNSKGIAKVKVKLSKRKTFKVRVRFAGDKSYKAVSKKSKVIIK